MAQTIALQRGATTTPGNGNQTTLFTQSGGIATRVIPNALGFYLNTPIPNNGTVVIGIYVAISGGQTLLVGYLNQGSSNFIRSFQFPIGAMPNSGPYGNVFYAPQTTWQSTGFIPQINGTTGVGSLSIENLQLSFNPGSGSKFVSLPSSFYIGPSDSIVIRGYNVYQAGKTTTYPNINVTYSFTTITET